MGIGERTEHRPVARGRVRAARAVTLEPGNAGHLRSRGLALRAAGALEGAAADLGAAVRLAPDDEVALSALG